MSLAMLAGGKQELTIAQIQMIMDSRYTVPSPILSLVDYAAVCKEPRFETLDWGKYNDRPWQQMSPDEDVELRLHGEFVRTQVCLPFDPYTGHALKVTVARDGSLVFYRRRIKSGDITAEIIVSTVKALNEQYGRPVSYGLVDGQLVKQFPPVIVAARSDYGSGYWNLRNKWGKVLLTGAPSRLELTRVGEDYLGRQYDPAKFKGVAHQERMRAEQDAAKNKQAAAERQARWARGDVRPEERLMHAIQKVYEPQLRQVRQQIYTEKPGHLMHEKMRPENRAETFAKVAEDAARREQSKGIRIPLLRPDEFSGARTVLPYSELSDKEKDAVINEIGRTVAREGFKGHRFGEEVARRVREVTGS